MVRGVSQKQAIDQQALDQAERYARWQESQEQAVEYQIWQLGLEVDTLRSRAVALTDTENELTVLNGILVRVAELETAITNLGGDAHVATQLMVDIRGRMVDILRGQIDDLPLRDNLEEYFYIIQNYNFAGGQRIALFGFLEDEIEEGLEARVAAAPPSTQTPTSYAAVINSQEGGKVEDEIQEAFTTIRWAWEALYTYGLARYYTQQQIDRVTYNRGDEEIVRGAERSLIEIRWLESEAIGKAEDAAASLPSRVLIESGLMVPRIEDIALLPIGDPFVMEDPEVSHAQYAVGRQLFMESIRNAAAEAYAEYLGRMIRAADNVDEEHRDEMRDHAHELVMRAPSFTVDFAILMQGGVIKNIYANFVGAVTIPEEGETLDAKVIVENIIQGIGQRVAVPEFMRYFRIKLSLTVSQGRVYAAIIPY